MPPGPLERAHRSRPSRCSSRSATTARCQQPHAPWVSHSPRPSAALRRLERRTGVDARHPGTVRHDPRRTRAAGSWCAPPRCCGPRTTSRRPRPQNARSTPGTLVVAASMTIAEHLAPRWIAAARRPVRPPSSCSSRTRVTSPAPCSPGRPRWGSSKGPTSTTRWRRGSSGPTSSMVVVAPEHPWARRRRPVGALELVRGTALAVRELGSGTRSTLERALAAAGAPAPRDTAQLGSTVAVKNLVRGGTARGRALAARRARGDRARHSLVAVEVDGIDLRRELRMVWSRGRQVPAGGRGVRPGGPAGAHGRLNVIVAEQSPDNRRTHAAHLPVDDPSSTGVVRTDAVSGCRGPRPRRLPRRAWRRRSCGRRYEPGT